MDYFSLGRPARWPARHVTWGWPRERPPRTVRYYTYSDHEDGDDPRPDVPIGKFACVIQMLRKFACVIQMLRKFACVIQMLRIKHMCGDKFLYLTLSVDEKWNQERMSGIPTHPAQDTKWETYKLQGRHQVLHYLTQISLVDSFILTNWTSPFSV